MTECPFPCPLEKAAFVRRPNRFLVEAVCAGRPVAAHLHDPGRLEEILVPGATLYLGPATGPGRKTGWTVHLAEHAGTLVSINSSLPNRLVGFGLERGLFHEFRDYALGGREVRLGAGRVDFHLVTAGIDIFMEVKGVSLVRGRAAFFPDAPTTRGARQVRDLIRAAGKGICGTLFFLVQRNDADSLRFNTETDPDFAAAVGEAFRKGLEIVAYTCRFSLSGAAVGRRIPVRL